MNPYVDGKTIKISKELLTKFRIIVSWDEAIREKDLESRRPWWGGGSHILALFYLVVSA